MSERNPFPYLTSMGKLLLAQEPNPKAPRVGGDYLIKHRVAGWTVAYYSKRNKTWHWQRKGEEAKPDLFDEVYLLPKV